LIQDFSGKKIREKNGEDVSATGAATGRGQKKKREKREKPFRSGGKR